MAPDSNLLFDDGDVDFHAALIGLGRRGCDCVRRLRQTGLADARAFLIDHDPDARQEEALPEALAAPAGGGWRERTRVTLVAVGAVAGQGNRAMW